MKLDRLKKELLSSIKNVCKSTVDIAVDPDRHFTRDRKLPLFEVIRCIISMIYSGILPARLLLPLLSSSVQN